MLACSRTVCRKPGCRTDRLPKLTRPYRAGEYLLEGADRCCPNFAKDLLLLGRRLTRLDDPFEPRNILHQALAGKAQEIITKFRVLEIELE
jgi:hypothetical protein